MIIVSDFAFEFDVLIPEYGEYFLLFQSQFLLLEIGGGALAHVEASVNGKAGKARSEIVHVSGCLLELGSVRTRFEIVNCRKTV